MEGVSRRHFICGTASLALLPAPAIGEMGPVFASTLRIGDHSLQCAMDRLTACRARFRLIENADLPDLAALHEWQSQYDDLVGAADVVREIIRDNTPGRDDAIAFAKACVPPSCMRAYTYWMPIVTLDDTPYARAGACFFQARYRAAMNYATRLHVFDEHYQHVGDVVDAVRVLRDTLPVTDADRLVLRRVIES